MFRGGFNRKVARVARLVSSILEDYENEDADMPCEIMEAMAKLYEAMSKYYKE